MASLQPAQSPGERERTIVWGLVSKRIQQRLLLEVDLSLNKAFKIAQSMETAHREIHEMRASGSQTGGETRQVNAISR